jgi:predicted phage tail protein
MVKKNKLTEVSIKIGTALGKADRQARKISEASSVAKEELVALAKQVDGLKRQLEKTTKRLKRVLT